MPNTLPDLVPCEAPATHNAACLDAAKDAWNAANAAATATFDAAHQAAWDAFNEDFERFELLTKPAGQTEAEWQATLTVILDGMEAERSVLISVALDAKNDAYNAANDAWTAAASLCCEGNA